MLSIAVPAYAADKSPPDQSGYSVLHPTPDDMLRDLCPDRPAKGTSACTVDAGRWQLEADVFDGSFQRQHGVTTDDWLVANPTLKLGLTNRLDIGVNLPLVESERIHDRGTGETHTQTGVGNLTLSLKYAVVGNSGSDVAFVLQPFVTLPTARQGLGYGNAVGGLLTPVSAKLPAGWLLDITPELDVLKDQDAGGRHLQAAATVGVSHDLPGGLNGTLELAAQRDFDPSGEATQASFDLALAWTPERSPDLQLDVGVNLGLTRDTPGVEIYAGVAKRF